MSKYYCAYCGKYVVACSHAGNISVWVWEYSEEDHQAVEKLLAVCQKLISYRDRNGALNFQLEKADDFINMMRPLVDALAAAAHSESLP